MSQRKVMVQTQLIFQMNDCEQMGENFIDSSTLLSNPRLSVLLTLLMSFWCGGFFFFLSRLFLSLKQWILAKGYLMLQDFLEVTQGKNASCQSNMFPQSPQIENTELTYKVARFILVPLVPYMVVWAKLGTGPTFLFTREGLVGLYLSSGEGRFLPQRRKHGESLLPRAAVQMGCRVSTDEAPSPNCQGVEEEMGSFPITQGTLQFVKLNTGYKASL